VRLGEVGLTELLVGHCQEQPIPGRVWIAPDLDGLVQLADRVAVTAGTVEGGAEGEKAGVVLRAVGHGSFRRGDQARAVASAQTASTPVQADSCTAPRSFAGSKRASMSEQIRR
jgi:hypothetical protein